MPITLQTWKDQLIRQLPGWKTRLDRAATGSAYYFIAASAFLPIVQAVSGGDWSALLTLVSTLGGSVGANLLANLAQQAKDRSEAEVAALLESQAKAQPDLQPAIATLIEKLDALVLAQQALPAADHAWFRRELAPYTSAPRYSATLHGDGAIAQGNGAIAVGKGGIVAGRDMRDNWINTGTINHSTINVSLPQTQSGPEPDPNGTLIAVVTKVEAQAVLKAFNADPGQARQAINHKIYYNLGTHAGAPLWMVQSEMGSATPGGALVTIRQAIQDLHPQAVVMCGIAYGLRPKKQKLGDILVARQLMNYEPQKVDVQRGIIPRGDRTTASERLLGLMRAADNEWQSTPVHIGLILSGEKLINDPAFRDWLLKTEPEAIGGEMEGSGLYAAARDAQVDWILVKAICDWADGEKNDAAQPLAAKNAAEFVRFALEMGK